VLARLHRPAHSGSPTEDPPVRAGGSVSSEQREGGLENLLNSSVREAARSSFEEACERLDGGNGIILAPLNPHPEFQGKAIPYGVYDLSRDEGWVSVGIDHDTASFAVNAIRSWWKHMGRSAHATSTHLLITADAGGSNGPKTRLWKWELQRSANRTGLTITVCHYPPGTSKWNKIEHRLFSFIAMNWRGKPLVSLATTVNLIAGTTTQAGLHVRSEIDKRLYPKAVKVSDDQMGQIKLTSHDFHGDWNYTIRPKAQS
jgi:hypothetical protein